MGSSSTCGDAAAGERVPVLSAMRGSKACDGTDPVAEDDRVGGSEADLLEGEPSEAAESASVDVSACSSSNSLVSSPFELKLSPESAELLL